MPRRRAMTSAADQQGRGSACDFIMLPRRQSARHTEAGATAKPDRVPQHATGVAFLRRRPHKRRSWTALPFEPKVLAPRAWPAYRARPQGGDHGHAQRHARQLFRRRRFSSPSDAASAQASRMIDEGAAIIDVGGEVDPAGRHGRSRRRRSRRGCCRSSRRWRSDGGALISIDTYRAETARLAVAAGAHIVNDVWGLQREPAIAAGRGRSGCRPRHHAHRARAREEAGRHRRPALLSRRLAGNRAERPASGTSRSCSIPASASPRRRPRRISS